MSEPERAAGVPAAEAGAATIEVRPLGPADVAAVAALAAEVPTAPHWPLFEFARLAKVSQAEPHRRGAWVAVTVAEIVGFSIARSVAGEAELESIVVAPASRRQGVGTVLLQRAHAWALQTTAEVLLLECRASNHAALDLYRRSGFAELGRRRSYYSNPEEDAVLMQCLLQRPQASSAHES